MDWEFSQAETIDFSHEMGGPGFVPTDPLSFLYLVAFVCSGSMFFTDHFGSLTSYSGKKMDHHMVIICFSKLVALSRGG